MFGYSRNKRSRYLFFSLSMLPIFLILSSCSVPSLTSFHIGTAKTPTPLPVTSSLNVPICHLASCVNFTPIRGALPFVDTGNNTHSFLSFDFDVNNPGAVANDYDFVWNAGPYQYQTFRNAKPSLLLSYYITAQRDDGQFYSQNQINSLSYWQQVHPEWVLYKCDRRTPAYEYGDPNVPFTLTNPAVLDWQVANYVKPAEDFGYDALAVDNVNMENLFNACGYYDRPGHWVQRYTGEVSDPQWEDDMANWVSRMAKVVHSFPRPMMFIPNYSIGAGLKSPTAPQEVIASSDAILDEGSFTHYGSYRLSGKAWVNMVYFIDSIQEQNKAFFSVNQYKLKAMTSDELQWIQGSYLMCNQHLEYLSIAAARGYGHAMTPQERIVPIGHALGEMYQQQSTYWRDFSNGEVIANPSIATVTITLPKGSSYVDPTGKSVGLTLSLPATTARILFKKA